MKRLIFLFVFVAAAITRSFGGTTPSVVENAFKQQFAEGQNVTWSQKGMDYVASFTWNSSQMMATYSQDGKWMQTDTKFPVTSLPKNVTEGIKKEYPSSQILSVDRIESASKNTYFLTKIKNNTKEMDLKVDATGTILK